MHVVRCPVYDEVLKTRIFHLLSRIILSNIDRQIFRRNGTDDKIVKKIKLRCLFWVSTSQWDFATFVKGNNCFYSVWTRDSRKYDRVNMGWLFTTRRTFEKWNFGQRFNTKSGILLLVSVFTTLNKAFISLIHDFHHVHLYCMHSNFDEEQLVSWCPFFKTGNTLRIHIFIVINQTFIQESL